MKDKNHMHELYFIYFTCLYRKFNKIRHVPESIEISILWS